MENPLVGFTSEPFRNPIEREKKWASCLAGLGRGVADGFHFPPFVRLRARDGEWTAFFWHAWNVRVLWEKDSLGAHRPAGIECHRPLAEEDSRSRSLEITFRPIRGYHTEIL